MNRAEFMKRLSELLYDVPLSEREEAIQYYNDYFDDAGIENEQGVIASLGTPEQVAATIKAGLTDGGSAGEFTERGFYSQKPPNVNEVLNPQKTFEHENDDSRQNSYGQKSGYDRSTDYGRQGGYGRSTDYGQQSGYGQSTDYGRQNNYGTQPADRKRMSGTVIVLLVLLGILASPLLIGLFGAAVGIIIGVLGAVFGLVVGLGVTAAALIVVGIGLFAYGIILIFKIPFGGLCVMGGAMLCAAFGLLLLWLVVLICAGLIPLVIRTCVNLLQKIFHNRGGARA